MKKFLSILCIFIIVESDQFLDFNLIQIRSNLNEIKINFVKTFTLFY